MSKISIIFLEQLHQYCILKLCGFSESPCIINGIYLDLLTVWMRLVLLPVCIVSFFELLHTLCLRCDMCPRIRRHGVRFLVTATLFLSTDIVGFLEISIWETILSS